MRGDFLKGDISEKINPYKVSADWGANGSSGVFVS